MGKGKPLGSMFIELGLDTSSFSNNVNGAKRAVNFFKAETRALDIALKNNGSNLTLLNAKHKTLNQTITKQKEVLVTLKKNFDKLDPGTAKWEKAAIEIERENAKLLVMEKQLDSVAGSIKKVQEENSKWGRASSLFSGWSTNLKNAGSTMREMGDAMAPISTIFTTAFVLSTKKAIDFESQLQIIKSLLSDSASSASELNEQTDKLGEASKKWARQYGISTSSINEGIQEIIKKGFDFNQTIAAMPSILNASKASGEDFNTVMNASTSILQQYSLQAQDTDRVTNSLTFVANKTAAGFSDMGNAMEYVGPVANATNISLEETAATIGLLSNNGIAGEKAGTALRGALTRLLKPSDANAAAMERLGFTTEEFKTGAIDLPGILDRIKSSTEGMTEAEKASLIAKAFGTEAQTGMNILVNQGGDALRNLTRETENAGGYTENLAKKMNQSRKSGVERFKSSLEVLQITIGQKLLPAITPLIERVNKIVTEFSEASPEVQAFWMMVAGGAAIAYPTLNFVGNLSTVTGSLFGWLSKIAEKRSAINIVGGLGTAASGATTATSGLAGAVGLLGNPITWGVILGGVAVGAVAWFAQQALDAKKRTEEWGTAVDKAQAKELQAFKDKVDETNRAMDSFGTEGAEDVENVRKAFTELTDEINGLVDENLAKDLKLAEKLGLSEEEIQRIKDKSTETKNVVGKLSEEVLAIYQEANNRKRQLSEEEKSIVLSAQNSLIQEQLAQLKYSGKEKEAITKAMNGQIDDLNRTQLAKALATTQKWIEDENKEYKSRKRDIEVLFDEGKMSQETYNREIQQLEAEHAMKMETYGDKYMKIREKMAKNVTFASGTGNSEAAYWNVIEEEMDKLGLSYEELQSRMKGLSETVSQSSSMVSTYWQGMSEEAQSAVTFWNSIVLDQKTGEVKTNAKEEIAKALEAEGGWEAMQLSLKEGKLTTTAKLAIGEALVANEQWESLSPSEKRLVTDNKPTIEAILSSETMMKQWNDLPEEVKRILGENKSFLTETDVAKSTLNKWNLMTPTQKALTAKNMTGPDVTAAQQTVNSLTGRNVALQSKNDTFGGVTAATSTLSMLTDKTVTINAYDNTYQTLSSISTKLNSLASQAFNLIINATNFEKGTNFHLGGLAMVNDQKGPLYKELVTLPTGESFIPEGRDVILPLPKGSKVLTASKTKNLMEKLGVPKYAEGIGIPEDSKILRMVNSVNRQSASNLSIDNQPVINVLLEILEVLLKQSDKTPVVKTYLDTTEITREVTRRQTKNERIAALMEGVII